MFLGRNPFQIGLGSGNWRAPVQWEGRVSMFTLARWILWDPYALTWYADLYAADRWPAIVAAWKTERGLPGSTPAPPFSRSEIPYRPLVLDILTVVVIIWGVEVMALLALGYLNEVTPRMVGALLGICVIGLAVGGGIVVLVSFFTFEHAAAALWGLILAAGVPLIAAGEIMLWANPLRAGESVLLAIWIVVGALLGVTWAGTLQLLERRRRLFVATRWVNTYWSLVCVLACMWFLAIIPWRMGISPLWSLFSWWRLLLSLAIGALVLWLSFWRFDNWFWGLWGTKLPDTDGNWTIPRVARYQVPALEQELAQRAASDVDALGTALVYLLNFSGQHKLVARFLTLVGNIRTLSDELLDRLIAYYDDLYFRPYWLNLYPAISKLNRMLDMLRESLGYLPAPSAAYPIEYRTFAQEIVPPAIYTTPLDTQADLEPASKLMRAFYMMEQGLLAEAEVEFAGMGEDTLFVEMAAMNRQMLQLWQHMDDGMVGPFPELAIPENPLRQASWDTLRRLYNGAYYLWLRRRTRDPAAQGAVAGIANGLLQSIRPYDAYPPESRVVDVLLQAWEGNAPNWRGGTPGTAAWGVWTPDPVPNPYRRRRGSGLRQPTIGREEIVDAVIDALALAGVAPVLLSGLPGSGVSTILDDCVQRRPLALVPLRQIDDSPRAGLDFLVAVSTALGETYGVPAVAVEEDLTAMLRTLTEQFYDLDLQASEPVVLAIDDLERVALFQNDDGSMRLAFEGLLTRLARFANINLLLAGHFTPQEHSMLETITGADTAIDMPLFARWDVETLLAETAGSLTNTHITTGAIDLVYERTGGHPYLVWLLGDSLIEAFNADLRAGVHRDPVFTNSTIADILKTQRVKRRAPLTFDALLQLVDRIDPSARDLLIAIARHPGLATTTRLGSPQVLARLAAAGLIAPSQVRYAEPLWRFTIPMFADYLR